MITKQQFDMPFCRRLVIGSTPSPSKFTGSDYTAINLGDLDLLGPRYVGFYITGVKSGIRPAHIDNVYILTARDTSVNEAAKSIYENAQW